MFSKNVQNKKRRRHRTSKEHQHLKDKKGKKASGRRLRKMVGIQGEEEPAGETSTKEVKRREYFREGVVISVHAAGRFG